MYTVLATFSFRQGQSRFRSVSFGKPRNLLSRHCTVLFAGPVSARWSSGMALVFCFCRCFRSLRVQSHENHKTGRRSANYTRRERRAYFVELSKKRRDDKIIFKKGTPTHATNWAKGRQRVVNSVEGDTRTLRPFHCDVSPFTNKQCSVYVHVPVSNRDSCSADLLLKAASSLFFAEQKSSFSVFPHATLPRPAIVRPALVTPILLRAFRIILLPQLVGTALDTTPPSAHPSKEAPNVSLGFQGEASGPLLLRLLTHP